MVVAWVGALFWNRGLSMGSYLRHRWWIPSAVSLPVKPALYRSVVFWLGCFVLLFLVWAWADSLKTRTSYRRIWAVATLVGPGTARHVGTCIDAVWVDSGRVGFRWNHAKVASPGLRGLYQRFEFAREPASGNEAIQRMPMAAREQHDPTTGVTIVSYRVAVPMWGVVVLYLMVCGGVMVWWRRRMRRVLLESGRTEEGVKA